MLHDAGIDTGDTSKLILPRFLYNEGLWWLD